MALLQKFQADIEDINKKNIEEQRAAIALQQEKERKDSKSKQALAQEPASKETTPVDNAIDIEVLLDIQTLLLSESEVDHSKARDSIAAAVTRQRGECIVLFGHHPPPGALYAATGTLEESASDNTWTGQRLSEAQLKQIVSRLSDVVDQIGGRVTQLFEHHTRTACLIRIPPLTLESTPEVRVGVVGNVDSGKSTTLGVLTRGGLDDGRGRARVALFRHKHEIETGRTSSVGMEILGFGPNGQPILPSADVNADPDVIRRERLGWEQIVSKSSKIVSFIDLAGHEKYLKTTLYGLTSGAPSCVILMVGANTGGLIGMSKEHLAITLALSVPVAVVISKIDMTPANVLQETIKQLVKVLKSPGSRKTPVFVNSFEIATQVSQEFVTKRLCPIFQVSNVTGEGLDKLRQFLNLLPSSEDESRFSKDMPFEYSVTEVWSVPYTGVVVNGIINSGRITAGDPILIGPDSVGGWITTAVKSIHRKRAPVTSAEAGQSVSFALKKVKKGVVRKGMVIIAKTDAPPKAVRRFEGQVLILYHNTTLSRNYQAMLHCGNIRQTVRIIDMDNPAGILRTGDRATVQFEFIKNPEFIKPGQKLLFREGTTKGLGVITRLL